jgi:hypothetical protein
MMGWRAWVLLFIILAGCQTAGSINEKPMNNEQNESIGADLEVPEYSARPYLELVNKYLGEDGTIDYQAWKDSAEDMGILNRQIELLALVSPDSHPAQFADTAAIRSYWINTYNTLVVQAVLEYWPLESVRDVKISLSSKVVPGKGFFYDRKVIVGGWETNLYRLEKEVLKSQKDPRLHFALNCASSSCPVLRPWEWTDEQLDQAARDFVNQSTNVKVDDETVYLSRIFKWYRKDFPEETYAYLRQFAQGDLSLHLQNAIEGAYPTKYFEYDWALNDAADSE